MPEPQQSRLPATCEVRDWVVFGPGYHRHALYTPADCDRVPPNFQKLRGYIDPVVKLGHDKKQRLIERLKKSFGFLNLGDFTAVTAKPGSRFSVSLTNVPTVIGGLINARRIRSGSVELIPFCKDPKDESKEIVGPIITGVSFLGEEHPAVKGFPPPRAVFADGTPVPANHDLTPWLEAMAAESETEESDEPEEVGFSELYRGSGQTYRTKDGHEYPLYVVCFSEMTPMVDAAFLKSLGLSEDQIAAIMSKVDGGAPGGAEAGKDAPPPPPAPMPPLPPPGGGGEMGGAASAAMPGPAATQVPDKENMAQDDQTMMSAAAFSDMKKRLCSLEAKQSDATRAAEMAAYSERVDRVLTDNVKRVPPRDRADYRAEGLRALSTKCFGAVTNNAEAAFAKWKGFIESLPESDKFSEAVDDTKPQKTGRQLSPLQQKIVNSRAMGTQSPNLQKKLL